jgi:hypothetical protein
VTTTQPSNDDLSSLLSRCARLKESVVEFARNKYRSEIQAKIATRSLSVATLSEWDVAGSIDDVIHEKDNAGRSLLEDFAENASDLSDEDRAIVLGWRESLWGVFEVHGHEGAVLETTNLVDSLDYRVVGTAQDPKSLASLSRPGFLLTRIDQLGDLWMMSGMQSLLKPTDRQVAFGMAARLAQEKPALFFRNPANLEKGREAGRVDHELFLAHFGAPWLIDTPREVERRYTEHLQLRGASSQVQQLRLPPELHQEDTVGAFSDPIEGLMLFPRAGSLMRAFEDPSALGDPQIRDVVLEYLERPSSSPAVLRLLAQHRPEQLDAMMAALLDRPGFAWERDGDALLRERNPSFLERVILPGHLPMSEELLDGARALLERDRQVLPKRPIHPKQRDKRKQAKAARRKNRR